MDGRVANAVAPRRRHQRDARAPQCQLVGGAALLVPDEAGHPRDHEQEQQRRRDDHDKHVGVPQLVHETNAGRDQARQREQAQPKRREPRARVCGRLIQAAHRRVQRRGAPQDVVGDPPRIETELVVVAVDKERICVGAVDGKQRDDAAHEQIEGRCPLPGIDRKADRSSEQQDVSERIRGRHTLREQREAGEVDVRRDEEDPGEERESNGQDP